MNVDHNRTMSVGLDKFQIEAEALGIQLSEEDYKTILLLFENKSNFNHIQNMPEINYHKVCKNIIPILTKNQDKASKYTSKMTQNFKIGWTLNSACKISALEHHRQSQKAAAEEKMEKATS